jgi:digeranylgeranylglycerophospholipid reductase
MENEEIVGVQYDGSKEVYGDVIIDATGPAAPLAKKLGVSDLERERQAIGIEFEFENVAVNHPDYADLRDAMMLRLDHNLAPGGYSWIFHTGGDTAKVGICYIQNDYHSERAENGMSVDDYLNRWLETDPRFENARRLKGKQHRGSAHIQPPGDHCTDNFIAIGDTVPSVDPLWGEGIHKGMKSARAAAVTVDTCLTPETPDTSKKEISMYRQLWHEQVAPRAKDRLLMTELLYFAPNDRYDRLMSDLRKTDVDTIADVNSGNKLAFRHLLHLSDIPMFTKFLRKQIGI